MFVELLLSFISAAFPNDSSTYHFLDELRTKEEIINHITGISNINSVIDAVLLSTYLERPQADENGSYEHLFNKPSEEWTSSDGISNWRKDSAHSANVSEISNAKPIEMQCENGFTQAEILEGLAASTQRELTSYGGCGPIATMGILDYFSRSAGFSALISDPDDHASKVNMAEEVLNDSQIVSLDKILGHPATAELPQGVRNAFNTYVASHGLNHFLEAKDKYTITGRMGSFFWTDIVNHIDQGLPVTLITGCLFESDGRLQHSVNVYGYETWQGENVAGETVEKKYLKVRMNWGEEEDRYYDADILDCYMVGIVTYDILKYSYDTTVTGEQLSHYFPTTRNLNVSWTSIDVPPSFSGWAESRNVYSPSGKSLLLSPVYLTNRRLPQPLIVDSFIEFGFYHCIQKVEIELAQHGASHLSFEALWVDCTCIDSDGDEPIISTFGHRPIPLTNMPNTGSKKYTLLLPRLTRKIKFQLYASKKEIFEDFYVSIKSLRICYL